MGAFREIGYGVLFFILAMAGAGLGWCVANPILRAIRPPPNTPLDIEMAVFIVGAIPGAVVGGLAWMVFKRLRKRKLSNDHQPSVN